MKKDLKVPHILCMTTDIHECHLPAKGLKQLEVHSPYADLKSYVLEKAFRTDKSLRPHLLHAWY